MSISFTYNLSIQCYKSIPTAVQVFAKVWFVCVEASTRGVYERKLRNLLLSNGHSKSNGKEDCADEAVLYSDSEEELEETGINRRLDLKPLQMSTCRSP